MRKNTAIGGILRDSADFFVSRATRFCEKFNLYKPAACGIES